MDKFNKLRYMILAGGVIASAVFYAREIGSGGDAVYYNDAAPAGDQSVGSEREPGDDPPTEETWSESELSALDRLVREALSDALTEDIRAAVREEIIAAGEDGYLDAALDESRLIAESEAERLKDMIDINTASVEELTTLSGIGESRARDIISYRETAGGFNDISEIMNVSGIGESTYARIKDKIYV